MLRILLVDDHAVVREGYRRLIEKQDGMSVIAEASDATEAYRIYKAEKPDIVVMDITLPGRGGIDAVQHIRQWDPEARILMFSMHCQPIYVLQAIRAGAKGYVTKSSPPDLLITALRDVNSNRIAICPEISEALAREKLEGEANLLNDLSPREFEILGLLLKPVSVDDIASTLHLSRKTVLNYHYTIKTKLGVTTDIELVHFGLKNGLISPIGLPRET